MRFTRTLFCSAALTFAAFIGSAAAAESTPIRFILDWAFQGQQSVFTIPLDDGTYKKLNLDVSVDRGSGSGDTVAKVASGAYDIGLADLYSMVRFNGENPNSHLIAVMFVHDKSALAVETLTKNNIKAPKDLEDKRIAAPVGDASRQLFPLFAAVNKIDEGNIKWLNVTPALREPVLLKGEADAITGHITTVMMNMRGIKIPEQDVLVMPYANYGVELYGHVLVTKPEFAAKHPEAITNFIRSTVHGTKVMMNDPDFGVASVKKRDPLVDAAVEKARIKMSLDYMFISPNVMQNGMSHVDKARLQRSLEAVAKPFELKTVPTVDQVYVDKYLPPQSELKLN
jgi:NitT/TauT family transport system substrate-binding protein